MGIWSSIRQQFSAGSRPPRHDRRSLVHHGQVPAGPAAPRAGPVGATHVHGITAADVASAPAFRHVINEISERLRGRALVARHAAFDVAFLSAEYERAGSSLPSLPTLCTLDASNYYLPDLSRRRLADCCWASGIRLCDAHSALGDARTWPSSPPWHATPSTTA